MFYKFIWHDKFLLSSWTVSIHGYIRRAWRYQRGDQNPYIDEEQRTQRPKKKVQKDKQRSTKHAYETKDRVTWTPPKIRVELGCSGRLSSSWSTSDTHNHHLHSTTYIQNASLSIMLPHSSGIFNFVYIREELIVIFKHKKL